MFDKTGIVKRFETYIKSEENAVADLLGEEAVEKYHVEAFDAISKYLQAAKKLMPDAMTQTDTDIKKHTDNTKKEYVPFEFLGDENDRPRRVKIERGGEKGDVF